MGVFGTIYLAHKFELSLKIEIIIFLVQYVNQ